MKTIAECQAAWGEDCFEDSQKVASALNISLEDAVAWSEGIVIEGGEISRGDDAFIKFVLANGGSEEEANEMLDNFSAYAFIWNKMGQ